MRRAMLLGFVLLLMGVAQTYAFSGFNEGYVWMTSMQRYGGVEYYDPILKGFKVDNTLTAVAGSFQVFSPYVPDNYVIYGHPSNQHGAGERSGLPSVYESSTADGYGKLLLGVYADNDPSGSQPTTQTMDVYMLSPQAGGTLNMSNVYAGKADVSGQFHTEDATQALYDKDGLFTGTPNSILVTGETGRMSSRGDGYCTDADSDGQFDGGADTDAYLNLANQPQKKVLYKNYLYGDSGWTGTYGGVNYGGADGIFQTVRLDNGDYVNTLYYNDCTTVGGTLDIGTSGINSGPNLAARDTNGNGIPDVYAGLYRVYFDHDDNSETPDVYAYGIGHFEDKSGNGVIDDGTECEVFFTAGRQNGPQSPDLPGDNIWSTNGGPSVFGVVESDNGEFALLCTMPGYWAWGVTYFALGIADNGEWSGEAQIICTDMGNGNWPKFGSDVGGNYSLWDEFPAAEAVIPEPGTMLLIGSGLVGMFGYLRRRRMR